MTEVSLSTVSSRRLLRDLLERYALFTGASLWLAGGIAWATQAEGLPVILFVLAAFVAWWPSAPGALRGIRRGRLGMGALVTIALAGALLLGEWGEAAALAVLYRLSEELEHWAMHRSRRAVKDALDFAPETADVLDPQTGRFRTVPLAEVAAGAVVLVRPGGAVPVDGEVIEGRSAVNVSMLTGEPLPHSVGPGGRVLSGSINGEGALRVRASKPAAEGTAAKIARLIDEARDKRAPVERWVEVFAQKYTPVMVLIAAAIAFTPPLVLGASFADWFYRGLVVLVIACPCALVISIPAAVSAGLAAAGRRGVLVKGGEFLEAAAKIKAVAFDKTGTLTFGRPELRSIRMLDASVSKDDALRIAAALEHDSEHPLARAVRDAAGHVDAAQDFRAVPGEGVEGTVDGVTWWFGNRAMAGRMTGEEPGDRGHGAVAWLGKGDCLVARFRFADKPRPEARQAVRGLHRLGVERVVLLTGDGERVAQRLNRALRFDEVRTRMTPAEKLEAVRRMAREPGGVMMLGDGINDAPALAAATVGVAMGAAGSDAAAASANVVLMTDDPRRAAWLIRHAQRVRVIVAQNIAGALGFKAVVLLLALVGLAPLWLAILADVGATVAVTLNSLRILHGSGD